MPSSTISVSANNSSLDSKRRRFQPPITTYFTSPSNPTCPPHLSHTHYSAATSSPTPVLPEKIQASLFSVGMRVRKSVAEGYKTKIERTVDDIKSTPALYSTRRPYVTARAELTPFSGMARPSHLMTPQPHAEPVVEDSDDQIITDEGDAFSLPPSSQESAASFSTQAHGQKRTYDYESDVEESDEFAFNPGTATWLDSSLGSAYKTGPAIGRTILAPSLDRQRRRFVAAQKLGGMEVDDFEEPSFLRRREEVDTEYLTSQNSGYEVQMGGV
ncbi:ribonucleotide reductase inhibitor-domain-containing protein [Aspergillus floccosus]